MKTQHWPWMGYAASMARPSWISNSALAKWRPGSASTLLALRQKPKIYWVAYTRAVFVAPGGAVARRR